MVGNYIVSFIGFLPANKPEYVVYVAIDNPKGVTQYGGTVSAPIAKNIMLSIINYKKLPQTTTDMTKVYNWYDTKYVKLPNVIGMNLTDAKKSLKGFKVEYNGTGTSVIEENPTPETLVKENSIVKIMLN
jgi:stage V sporulation protein D (sporulation-specific penicillin-binding protein)